MKMFTQMKQIVKDASLRFSLLFWIIALHSFLVGLVSGIVTSAMAVAIIATNSSYEKTRIK
jgi:hypothetical protein